MIEEKISKLRQDLIKNNLLNDDVLDYFEENRLAIEELYSYYECAIMEVETKFNVLNKQFSRFYDRNPIESVSSRLKSPRSLIRKIKRYGIDLNIPAIEEGINDIAGVRVICSFVEDIYEIERCFLKQDDIKLLQVKDYIENPKESGYRSLHLIVEVPIFLKDEKKMVRVEVQMRTIAMDFWASLEHKIRYKKNISDEELEKISGELKQCADISHQLDLRMQAIRIDIAHARNEEFHPNVEFPLAKSLINKITKE